MQSRGNLFEHPEFRRLVEEAKARPYRGRPAIDVAEITGGSWYVLELYSGREASAADQINNRIGLGAYVPIRRKLICGRGYASYRIIRRPLFVGYGFVLARNIDAYVGLFCRCPDVLGVMTITAKDGSTVYATVDWDVIRHIQASENGNDESLTVAAQVALDADRKRVRSRRRA
jgi:transcription antitermination factor NusG